MRSKLRIEATERGIKEVRLEKRAGSSPVGKRLQARRWLDTARTELRAYFTGRLRSFSVPCDLSGLPRFTRAVLRVTARIPYGEVRSYRWVAERLGSSRATRAVGGALARNPVPILIPCHRVVRGDGSLGGYSLGLSWKRKLLGLERGRLGHSSLSKRSRKRVG